MPIEKKKNVTINGREFQVGRIPSNVGSWILMQILGGRAADFEVQQKIQRYLFNACGYFKTGPDGEKVPMLVYQDGKWLAPELELEYDLDTVNTLYAEALDFNFTDVIQKHMSKEKAHADVGNVDPIDAGTPSSGIPTTGGLITNAGQ